MYTELAEQHAQGAEGEAVSFCRPVDLHLLAEIEKLLGNAGAGCFWRASNS